MFNTYPYCTCDYCLNDETCYGTGQDDDVLCLCLECLKKIAYGSYVQHVKKENVLDFNIVGITGKHCQGSNRGD